MYIYKYIYVYIYMCIYIYIYIYYRETETTIFDDLSFWKINSRKFRKLLKYLAKHTLIFSVQESICNIKVCNVPFKTRSCH